jgi:hypothetical protein
VKPIYSEYWEVETTHGVQIVAYEDAELELRGTFDLNDLDMSDIQTATAIQVLDELRDFVIGDPFCAKSKSGWLIQTDEDLLAFDSEDEAQEYLDEYYGDDT